MSPRRWVPVLVAVDAVLVAAVLVVVLLVVVHPGGGTQSPAPYGGSGTLAAPPSGGTASGSTPTSTPGPPRFRLPSGNIACDMTPDGVTCTVASATFTPPPVEGCTGTVGHTVVLDTHGVSVPCVDGPAPTAAGDDVPVLFYAATSTVGQYTCTRPTNGVTCPEATGVGFRPARASLATLP